MPVLFLFMKFRLGTRLLISGAKVLCILLWVYYGFYFYPVGVLDLGFSVPVGTERFLPPCTSTL